ncbi:MAG TPA: SGNH/GDSL hydrolase family protein [Gordonia sp. (in: high G+C Gram-positive bacteria)]|uniref:SGNH/GDSL hydrolase family protein n=1 Tax=unclassified Gordonia (in: high G+C Gram-positive bacteria) TaxID=2657482 RepID=UPI000FC16AA5|nr:MULTISPECIES: SGNH/GDSL hydrolase family protein [unclassified Gordonia (in: high G+C Gram-positive bacteria)]RUP37693.1 MAG: SGNH/GDSL hydrolase family protein [Gordonia sp. (in: high G+C Gram-positive bacteria)]HNP56103.1 SGNH/GDSL hydrolase family protein [Gordonia sp. (in: high G+C Gram-positive bacteria)]HRC49777.1 SGNH/GDSL hydrolase family protein [Gordonia sp. (in: high G+C Gram-positive bacteria)]
MRYSRFVAIGDSQTEGMGDPHPDYECRGWADRLAERMAALNPELTYANLAIRGKNTRQALEEQLDSALAMEPDLVAAPLGMNDVIGSGDLTGQVRSDLDEIYGRLTDSGATVIVSTYPDVTRTIPLGHRLEGRLQTINALMREFAHRYGLVLVDLHSAPVLTDLRAWSTDRLHASSLGHQRLADGAAHALGLPGASPTWGDPMPDLPDLHPVARVVRDVRWAVEFFTPWAIRRIRGVSLGDGRSPKRPELTPVVAPVHC